jgi:hypothetical protein
MIIKYCVTSQLLTLIPILNKLKSIFPYLQNRLNIHHSTTAITLQISYITYCSMSDTKLVGKAPEVRSVSDAVPPNKTQSSTSFTRITRTISPKYLPLIYFSNLKKKKNNNKLHLWEKSTVQGIQ